MTEKKLAKIIAVDFDGTLCENAWPEIGEPRKAVIDYVLKEQREGARLILWTCRSKKDLSAAVKWCAEQGIVFDAINENLMDVIGTFGVDSRKVFANEYIDDRGVSIPNMPCMLQAKYYVQEALGKTEILVQLAEECAELAQAALKYRRVLEGKNPTPISEKTAEKNFVEEVADVGTCLSMLCDYENDIAIRSIRRDKTFRWARRLKEQTEGGRENEGEA